MASNVSNLLKEKIVTPVANSVAAQVDNKVKNGIILRKFIGVQLGESNTGCQLVKIDLNKINVKDPSYEFTLYIKAFSQKGLFNFIVNVNKTDSLQVDVKCEVKNSDSSNGEAIGYYDVDAVGNTIIISLVKAFVVNTSINECKFVSTKDTLNISDLDIDWSDTGNVKTSSSINIRYNQTSIYEYDEYFHPYKPDFADGEMYQIAKFDFSEILNKTLTGNKDFNISIDIIYHLIGEFHICFDLTWIRNMSMINLIRGAYEKIPFQSTMEKRNFDELFKFCRKDNTTLLLLINPPAMYMSGGDFVIRRIEVHRADADIESDLVKIDVTPEKLVNSDGSLVIGSIERHKASIPAPTTSEVDNKYLLGADAKWHPRKAVNDSFIDLEPDDTIKGLDIEDATKAVSFVTFNFSNIVTKLTELSKNSTGIYFEMELETTASLSNDYHINGTFMVNKSGLIPTTVYTTSLTQIDNRNGYLENPTALYNELIDTPGFYIMDSSLKTVTFALYTVFANSTVRIKDFYIHVDESVISLEDLTIEWKLLAIDKPEWVILRVQKFINGSLIPPTRIFEQMNIETPIDEADSFTLEKERVKNNGLVPAPGKYEVDNGYVLGADAKWHPRKAGNEYIANLKPTEEIKGLSETDTTKGISFVTIDFNTLSQKVVEAAPSTLQEFGINMKVLTRDLGIITISTSLSVTTAGLVACTGVLSDRGMGSNSVSFSTKYSGKLGAVTTPGFFVNDRDTKILKIALYTPIAIDGVKIIDAVVTSYSDIIDESDIVFTWELGILEKKPYKPLTSNIIYPRIDLDRELVFDQMNIETPISETDEDTLFAEQIKHNGLVPAPGKYEVDNKYLLGADAKWHPRKAGNEYIANLKPTEEILRLTETDTTKGVSFVTIDFNTLSQKIVEATPSTYQEFRLDMKVLVRELGVVDISVNFSVTVTGVIACTGVTSNRGLNSGNFSITFASKIGSIPSPGFFVNDYDTKIFKLALYTVFANNGVKIIEAQITSYSDLIDENDIICTWELGVLDKLPAQIGKSNEIYLGVDLPRNQTFRQMNIETPIAETEETTVEAEQLKYNGLVPAPGKYEVENQYFLKADGTWDLPKNTVQNVIATVTPTSEMISQVEAAKTTKLISFLTIDVNEVASTIEKAERFVLSLDVLTNNFGLVRIGFNLMITATGNSNISSFSSNLGTNLLPVQLTHISNLKDYGVETMSPIFAISDTNNKGIFNIGFNGNTMKEKVIVLNMSCIPKQSTVEYKAFNYIFEPTLIDLDSSTTIRRLNSTMIGGYMDPSKIFTPISTITSEDIVSETDPYELSIEKMRNNGFVPAPAKYEADQGKVLRADGTWGYQKKPLNDMIATVSPSEENIEAYKAAKETKRISFVTIDFTNVMNKVSSGMWSGKLHFDVSEFNFGTTHLYLLFIVNKTMCNVNIFSTLGTNQVDDSSAISSLMDYGVETSSPIFVTNEGDSKNIIRIGFNGVSATRNISILDCYIDSPYDITIDDLVISWESSIIDTTLVNKYLNSKVISYMDSGDVFSSISNITSPSMIESTDAKTLKTYKLRYNGFVPAPYQYEADQGYVLYADGTWGPIKGIIRNRTFTVTPSTDSSSTQTNDYVITEGAEDLAIAINENYSVDINIVFSGLGTKNNNNTTLTITGVTGTVNLYDYSGNPIKYITDGMSMKCTIFKNTIDDPVESMNAYCIYDIVSYPDTINGPSE